MPQSGQSLKGASAAGVGSAIYLDTPTRAVSAQISISGTTKAVFRIQGSVSGQTWVDLGTAATTQAAAAAGTIITSTYAHYLDAIRLNLVSRTTSPTAAVEVVNGWIAAAG